MRLLKEKSISMIFLIIISTIYFGLNFQDVESQRTTGQNACCEITKNGESCVYTDISQCDVTNGQASRSRCEDTSYCTNICCVDQANGCFPNTPKGACQKQQNSINNDASCKSVNECALGCCVAGNQYSFTSENNCKNLLNTIYGTNYDFSDKFKTAGSEQECLKLSLNDKEGCCVDNCKYGIKSSCGDDFKLDTKCSSLNKCSNCKERSYKECKDGNIYWFDSCGNPEDLIQSCDYSQGNLCANENGNVYCRSLDCSTTKKYSEWDYTGKSRQHGESWCVYESPTGNFLDRPGSIQYRNNCLNNEEVSESCGDFRKQVCVQANFNNSGFSEASCVNNNIYNSPVNANISTVPVGFKFWEANKNKDQCKKGSTKCTVYYAKKDRISDWECKGNCFCETQEFIDEANNYCKSFGDCGFNYNTLGKEGSGGLNVYWTGSEIGDNPTTLSQAYLESLKKFGIYGGMSFLSTETEKVIPSLDIDNEDIFEEVLISGIVGYSIFTIINIAFLSLGQVTLGFSLLLPLITGGLIVAPGAGALSGGIFVTGSVGGIIFGVIAVAILITTAILGILSSGGSVKEKTINIDCSPWQAPLGGKDCGKCTEDSSKECTEYKCRSLGASCRLVNTEAQDLSKIKCVDSNPNDVGAPKLSPYAEGYSPVVERLGYRVENVEPLKLFNFGVITDEDATCKYDFKFSTKYDEMQYPLSDFLGTKHNMTLILQGGKEFKYYVKCRDMNGNAGTDYLITIKTKKEPDKQAPIIIDTSIKNNGVIPSNLEAVPLDLVLNEPATCKYDTKDNKKYEDMNNLSLCNAQFSLIPTEYKCTTALTGLKKGINTFFFKCRDLMNNTNTGSIFSVIRSESLNITIDPITPKDSVVSNNIVLSLTTIGGSEQGKSICKYSDRDLAYEGMTLFLTTDSSHHVQPQTNLKKGNYNYYVKCRDNAGNEDSKKINFKILGENVGSSVIYVYKDSFNINVVLNAESSCEYSNKQFSFGAGEKMSDDNTAMHSAPLVYNEYYIQCKDSEGKNINGLRVSV